MEANDEFIPENPLYCVYEFTKNLPKDTSNILELENYKNIFLCVYNINTNGKFPFLQYLLANSGFNTLCLPQLTLFDSIGKKHLNPYTIVYLSGILLVEYEKLKNSIIYDGFYEFDSNLYLFYNVTNCEFDIDETYSSYSLRFGIIDEIINRRNICNIPITTETTDFFIKNDSILFLTNEFKLSFEIPIIGFVSKPNENKIKFTHMFGESPKNKEALMGPFYYFTNYTNSLNQCLNQDNGGIIRFALFPGTTKYVENFPNDNIDNSITKKQLINNENRKKIDVLTSRISDHDGLWSKKYDSVFVAKLELDDGTYLNNTPMLVLKDYEQQTPLSYHYINKNTMRK
jgi:hypothetical protein